MKFTNKILSYFHKDDPAQFRKELLWLWKRMLRHKTMVFMVCVMALIGTLMGLASSVATKYLIDAVTLRNHSLLTAAVLYIPILRDLFGFAPISLLEFAIALGLALLIVPMVELTKWIGRRAEKKKKK